MYKAVQMDDGSIKLVHHGIEGQKWGVRRFQNEDGSLTPAGRERYASKEDVDIAKKTFKAVKKLNRSGGFYDSKGNKIYVTNDAVNDARSQYIMKKGSYIAGKKGENAEERFYTREFTRKGLPGSISDATHNLRMTDLANNIAAKKGKGYTENILRKANNRLTAQFLAGTALTVGSIAVSAYLSAKN